MYSAEQSCPGLSFPPSQRDINAFLDKAFDYVIVGGGTAGMVLAARLAENPALTIGVIEAGQFHPDDPLVNIPERQSAMLGNPTYDWNFLTIPQSHAGNRNVAISRGKMLGGSSGLNLMAYDRASADEYNALAQLSSNSNLGWDQLLPFFKKAEKSSATDPFLAFKEGDIITPQASFTGFSGPISASYNEFYSPDIPLYVQTLSGMGISVNSEPDSGNATGLYNSRLSVNRMTGRRSYSGIDYFCSGTPRPNLQVIVGAQVTRILFNIDGEKPTAIGARFTVQSRQFEVRSKKEVILSAGPVKTPQLLELSGIGNRTILSKLGIKTILDLPGVGENIQEHPYVAVEWKLRPGHQTFDILRNDPAFANQQETRFNATGTGLLAALDSTVAFLPMQQLVSSARLVNLTRIFDRETKSSKGRSLQSLQSSLQRTWFTEGRVAHVELVTWSRATVNPSPNTSYISILGGAMHPTSRGRVHVSSTDPLQTPLLDVGFLNNDFDVQTLLDTLKFIQRIGQKPPFSSIVESQTSPDPSQQTDEALIDYIRNSVAAGGHLIGSAALAPLEYGGVVDSSFRVHGTTNLRVVDASILPIEIAAHLQATVYAVAEMAVSIILSS